MSSATAPNGTETAIRAIVFKEGDVYVAQCLEYDIAAQAKNIAPLLDRLALTLEAEFATCEARGMAPLDCIAPAPNYYHGLWAKRTVDLARTNVPLPGPAIQFAMAA